VAPGFLGYTSSDGIVMLAKIDPEKVSLLGEPRPVLTNVRVEPYFATAQFAVSDAGTLAYIEGPAAVRGSFVWHRDGTLVPVGLQEGNYAGFRLSRDGRRLISVVHGSAGPFTLRVFDLSGQSAPQVVPDQAPRFSSAWWPDSTSFVHGSRTGWIVRRTVRDMAIVERVKDDGNSEVVDVSPDGKTVVLLRWQAATDPGIWFMSWPDGKRTLVDGDRAAGFGSFSRDGKWFAYARPEPTMTRYEVRVSPVSNPAQSRAVAIGYSPTWSPGDKELLYANDARIWSMRRTGEEFDKQQLVYEGQFLVGGQIIEVDPDGRLLLAVPKPQPPVREIRVIPNWLAKVTADWK
jgi:Tol biopolymer transport system component